jgi:hypothetical protein
MVEFNSKKNLQILHQTNSAKNTSVVSNFSDLKEIVGAVVIFDHGLKFGIIFLVSDHPAHKKLIASNTNFYYRITSSRISDLLAEIFSLF